MNLGQGMLKGTWNGDLYYKHKWFSLIFQISRESRVVLDPLKSGGRGTEYFDICD